MNKATTQNRFLSKRTIIIIATLLSLGIIGSAFAYHRHHAGYGHRVGLVKHIERNLTEKLELNETQQSELNQLAKSLMDSRKSFRKQRFFDLEQVFPLLESDTLDQEKMLGLVRERLAMVEAQAQQVIGSVAIFTDSLDPEQRAELKNIIEKRVSTRRDHDYKRNHKHD